jgi:hypothetical protein
MRERLFLSRIITVKFFSFPADFREKERAVRFSPKGPYGCFDFSPAGTEIVNGPVV